MPTLSPDALSWHLTQLRTAREATLADSENFLSIVHALEELGTSLAGEVRNGFGGYRAELLDFAQHSSLDEGVLLRWRGCHTPAPLLFELVRSARNDAAHQGASARNAARHAVELALIMEEALMGSLTSLTVTDCMVRDVVTAQLWQPLSLLRKHMLVHQFSFLPFLHPDDGWKVVSDAALVRFLGTKRKEREKRLSLSLQAALLIGEGEPLAAATARTVAPSQFLESVASEVAEAPVLVLHEGSLVGLITAFDLL